MKAAYQLQATQRNLTAAEPILTADERDAATLAVERVPPAPGAAGGAGGRGGELTPLPLADVMAVLKAHEAQGSIKLVSKR